MSKMVLDAISAWHELGRFAEVAGVEMDERSHPDYDAAKDDTDEEAKADKESEEVDYDTLIKALRRGQLSVGDGGVLVLTWLKPPISDRPTMTLDPNDYAYGQASMALGSIPNPPAVSKAAKKRARTVEYDNNLRKMHRFIEILACENPGTLERSKDKRDTDLITAIASFLISG